MKFKKSSESEIMLVVISKGKIQLTSKFQNNPPHPEIEFDRDVEFTSYFGRSFEN